MQNHDRILIRSRKTKNDGAKAFSDFMLSAETKGIIKACGVEKYGSALFFPDAGKKEDDLGK
jgi:tungstate transport system substrate-binding protein